jgi:hypothetical protein
MPVESAQFISQLVPSNPITTDPLAQGQQHIAMLKAVLQSQFPNLGAAAVTASAAELVPGIASNISTLQGNTTPRPACIYSAIVSGVHLLPKRSTYGIRIFDQPMPHDDGRDLLV